MKGGKFMLSGLADSRS